MVVEEEEVKNLEDTAVYSNFFDDFTLDDATSSTPKHIPAKVIVKSVEKKSE